MTDRIEIVHRAPEIARKDRGLIGNIMYFPQALITSITGDNGLLGRTASFLTNPWLLAPLLTLAGGYHVGMFSKLGELLPSTQGVSNVLDEGGRRVSFGAQNFWNWMRTRFTTDGMIHGAIDREGQIYNPGSGILNRPDLSSDLIT